MNHPTIATYAGFVAVASQDRIVRVYDILTYKLSRRFSGHTREISDLAFSPDGRRLLSSSLDGTMRIWDMPTGRCLSWLTFDAPVLSMAMSHSGEYLSLTQAGKDGIYMYVDRSLYETVHFWKEPTAPTSVMDSVALIDQPDDQIENRDGLIHLEDEGQAEVEESQEMDVMPVQAQVETGAPRESRTQRGAGLITMAAVARAYWTSLFNLEAIKKRNSATAAPAAAVKAPFFLPTVVRGGSTPSFPTPAEFEKIMKKNAASLSVSEGLSSDLKRKREEGSSDAKEGKDSVVEDEASVLAQLASMGSAWGDADGDGDGGDASWGVGAAAVEKVSSSEGAPSSSKESGSVMSVGFGEDRKSSSKILNRKTAIPRCKLVAFILQEYPSGAPVHVSKSDQEEEADQAVYRDENGEESDGPILEYLKNLPPPAVDLEFRALCTHENDEEGTVPQHVFRMSLAPLLFDFYFYGLITLRQIYAFYFAGTFREIQTAQ